MIGLGLGALVAIARELRGVAFLAHSARVFDWLPGCSAGAAQAIRPRSRTCRVRHRCRAGSRPDPTDGPAHATYVVRHGRNEMGFPNGGMTAFDATMLSDVQLGAILDFLGEAAKPTTGADLYTRFCVTSELCRARLRDWSCVVLG